MISTVALKTGWMLGPSAPPVSAPTREIPPPAIKETADFSWFASRIQTSVRSHKIILFAATHFLWSIVLGRYQDSPTLTGLLTFLNEVPMMIAQYLPEFNLFHLLVVCIAFALGGFVKGISAFGLPTIAVPIIVFFMSLPAAVAIMTVQMVITNFVQMIISGQIKPVVMRHWLLFLGLFIGLPIGVFMLSAIDTKYLLIAVGGFLIFISALEYFGISFAFLGDHEKIYGPIIGLIAGIIGGITTLFGTLPVFFFIALGLQKEKFVAAVSVMLFGGSIFLLLSLQGMNFLKPTEIAYSLIGLAPLFAGMWAGTKVRHRIDQVTFKKIVLGLVVLIGLAMIYRAFN